MSEDEIVKYITTTFKGASAFPSNGNYFFFYDPDQKFPFATLVTTDEYDQASNLSRPSVFRLNIGVSKQTFQSLFGSTKSRPGDDAAGGDNPYDFTALDQLMPHPVYGMMYWVCVLNPTEATFQALVKPLLAEAYEQDVRKHTKRADRKQGRSQTSEG